MQNYPPMHDANDSILFIAIKVGRVHMQKKGV